MKTMFSLRIMLIVVMLVSVVVSLVVQEKKVAGSEETNVLLVRTQGAPPGAVYPITQSRRYIFAFTHSRNIATIRFKMIHFTKSRRNFILFTHHAFTQVFWFSRIHTRKKVQSRNHADLWGGGAHLCDLS